METSIDVKKQLLNELRSRLTADSPVELVEQIQDLELEIDPPVKFGMEFVDLAVSPDDKPIPSEIVEHLKATVNYQPLDEIGPQPLESVEPELPTVRLVPKLKTRPISEIFELADTYISGSDGDDIIHPIEALSDAVQDYKLAKMVSDQFNAEHKDIISEKSKLSLSATIAERTIAGLLARHAETGAMLVEGDTPGLWKVEVENSDMLFEGTGYSVSYNVDPAPEPKNIPVINDPALIEWCKIHYADALTIDARKIEDFLKKMIVKNYGKRKQELLPSDMPPAEIVPYIQPTVGKISYADLTSEETFKIEFERQGETEPMFKIVSSHSGVVKSGLTYAEAKPELDALLQK